MSVLIGLSKKERAALVTELARQRYSSRDVQGGRCRWGGCGTPCRSFRSYNYTALRESRAITDLSNFENPAGPNEVGNESWSENQGSKLGGRSNKKISSQFLSWPILITILSRNVLLWLSHKDTLRKEFQKDKLSNILLWAVPFKLWVIFSWLIN